MTQLALDIAIGTACGIIAAAVLILLVIYLVDKIQTARRIKAARRKAEKVAAAFNRSLS